MTTSHPGSSRPADTPADIAARRRSTQFRTATPAAADGVVLQMPPTAQADRPANLSRLIPTASHGRNRACNDRFAPYKQTIHLHRIVRIVCCREAESVARPGCRVRNDRDERAEPATATRRPACAKRAIEEKPVHPGAAHGRLHATMIGPTTSADFDVGCECTGKCEAKQDSRGYMRPPRHRQYAAATTISSRYIVLNQRGMTEKVRIKGNQCGRSDRRNRAAEVVAELCNQRRGAAPRSRHHRARTIQHGVRIVAALRYSATAHQSLRTLQLKLGRPPNHHPERYECPPDPAAAPPSISTV